MITYPTEIEIYDLLAAMAPDMKSYLGVGVQEGVCVENIVRANPTIDLILCDDWGPYHGGTNRGNHDHIIQKLKWIDHQGSVIFLDGDSTELIPKLTDKIDFAFVDGAHNYEAAKADMTNVWPLVNKAMVIHDIWMPEVLKAFNDWWMVVSWSDNPKAISRYQRTGGVLVVWR